MLDFQLFGLNPHGTHIVNLLFHITNALLLLFIFYRLTGAVWRSAFVAALFALHPLHVQSVAWASERKDVLSTFFFMLTVIAYCRHTERPTLKRYIMIILFFTLGLMAKPMLVSLPFVLLLLDYWPLQRFAFEAIPGRNQKRFPVFFLILEKIPLFLLAALSSAVTYMVQKKGGSVYTLTSLPLTSRLSNAFVSYMIYIQKTIWPNGLAVFYPFPKFLPKWEIAGAVVVFSLTTLATLLLSKRFKYLTVGWFWYLITLVPVIGLVQAGAQARADRYTYVPLIGLFIMAAWGIPELTDKLHIPQKLLAVPAVLLLACLSAATWDQAAYWQNSITLFGHAIEVTKGNYIAYDSLGGTYMNKGDYRKALQYYDKEIEINPRYPNAFYNRGVARADLRDYQQALADYQKTVELDPGYANAYYNGGNIFASFGNYQDSISCYRKAVQANPELIGAYNNMGNSYAAIGDYAQAIANFTKVMELDPGYVNAYLMRGIAYRKLGDTQRAYADLEAAARLGEKHAQAFLIKHGLSW